jgi:hypothetical protein
MTVVVADVRSKTLPSHVVETQMGDGMLGFHPHFDIRHNWDGRAISSTRRPHSKAKGTFCTHFCWRLSGPQGWCMRPEGIGHLPISTDSTGNRTRNLPSCGAVLQTNCTTARNCKNATNKKRTVFFWVVTQWVVKFLTEVSTQPTTHCLTA